MKRLDWKMTAVVLVAAGTIPVSAHANYGPGGGRPPQGPPPEAFAACKEKSEGDAVTITTPRGDTIKATCRKVDGQLAAVPEGMPRGPKGGRPPEGDPPRE